MRILVVYETVVERALRNGCVIYRPLIDTSATLN